LLQFARLPIIRRPLPTRRASSSQRNPKRQRGLISSLNAAGYRIGSSFIPIKQQSTWAGKDASTLNCNDRSKRHVALTLASASATGSLARTGRVSQTVGRISNPSYNAAPAHIRFLGLVAVALLAIAAPHPLLADPIIQSPVLNSGEAIRISARQANRWQEQGFEVWHLRGDCRVAQDNMTATGSEAIVWIKRAAPRSGAGNQVLVYFEGKVRVDYSHRSEPHRATGQTAQSITGRSWFGRLESSAPVDVQTVTVGGRPTAEPEIYARGREASQSQATQPRQAQFTGPETIPAPAPSATLSPMQLDRNKLR